MNDLKVAMTWLSLVLRAAQRHGNGDPEGFFRAGQPGSVMHIPMQRRTWLMWTSALAALAACGQPSDPQAALEAAVQRLQDALEAKDADAVLDMLDPRFRAQSDTSEGLDREWARKTMALMFLRYAQVKVIAVTRSSRVDAAGGRTGRTEAQVLITGAQGLIPERAAPYRVELQWWREGDDWLLRDLRWE